MVDYCNIVTANIKINYSNGDSPDRSRVRINNQQNWLLTLTV